ncbi:hypothetical protein B566_EDAN002096 [Ephemera danica]|nr:hypothetical protein B566_EDAN002096 [Ephemera danica]
MFSYVLLAISVHAVLASPLGVHKREERIVGGTPVAWGEIPWQVSIQDNVRKQFCGGSIISADWIVTVAHCSLINPSNYRVVTGTLEYKVNGTIHIIEEIISHADYDSNSFENDIAVWKVYPPFEWGEQTAPVTLPMAGVITPENQSNLTVSGWGDQSYGGRLSDELLKTDFLVVNKTQCNRDYLLYGGIGPNMICGGVPEGGRAPCQGDSGGPVMYEGELRGLVSWALGCGWVDYPSVFTEVSAYRDWIRENSGV